MSINIPSKWGFCDDVFIVPIKIQNSYFTAVMDAPDDWNDALIVSGFKKTNEGWIKKGLANEYELSYLSTKVSVEDVDTSFFDNYFNPIEDTPTELAIPDEVAKTIEWLGTHGRKALFFEFSLVYPELTDIALSGYLEDAAAGVSNSDTDIVYELAIERIKALTGGELSESVVEFAKEKNISLVVQPDSVLGSRGSVLLQRGDSVSWKDKNGVEVNGRVSRPLMVGDEGCWLYSLPVIWVGGYPSPNEMWVSTKDLGVTVEASAAEIASDSMSYDSAVEFLSNVKRLEVEELGERIFSALEKEVNAFSGYDYKNRDVWIANGKLWTDADGIKKKVVELGEDVLALDYVDRKFVRDLSDALDVINKREFGSDSFERTSICFRGLPGDGEDASAYLQYNLSALFPVDQPYMQIDVSHRHGGSRVAKELGDDYSIKSSEDQPLFDCVSDYIGSMVAKTAAVMSYAPREGDGIVVSAHILQKTISRIVDSNSGFDLFKDRIIELGIENSVSSDFVHRLMGFNSDDIIRSLDNVTPKRVADILSYPDPDQTDYKKYTNKGVDAIGSKGFSIWRNVVKGPVVDVNAVSWLVRNDQYMITDLPHDYYAVSGPDFGPTNDFVQDAIKEAGLGKIYDFSGSFSYGLIKTDVVFKAGFDHIKEDSIKATKMLKKLGCFDKRPYWNAPSDGFSKESFDKWNDFVAGVDDFMRLSSVMDKARTLDRSLLKSVVDAEVDRQWAGFFDKAGYGESVADKAKASVFNHIVSEIDSCIKNGLNFSEQGADAFIFRITASRSRIMWSKLSVDTLSEKDVSADWTKEPRGVMLDYAFTSFFGNKRGGKKLVIDLLSVVDPELAGRLYSIGDNQNKEIEIDNKPNDAAGHQDTGVVTGYAIKDLRAMNTDALLTATKNMSSTQREKYVKKDLYFPRIPMIVLKEKGCTPALAALLDQAWVLLPSKPYSMMTQDVEDYGRLITAAKKTFDNLLESEIDLGSGVTADFVRQWDESMMENALPLLSNMDRSRRSFYRNKTSFKNVYMLSAFGLSEHAGHHEDNYKYISQIFMDRFSVRKGGEKIRGRNLEWSHLLPVKAKAETKTVAKKVMNPDIRTGEDYRKGKVLDSEDFIKTFGFSGVEFGNWTNQIEREAHINLSYDSMLDFSKVLNCEPMALSLGGRLGLCFGSRGRGGKNPASAHYEPSNMAINLTRRAGAGSLAHEYFHAIAGHYGEVESGIKGADYSEKTGNMVMGGVDKISATPLLREEMQEAFFNLMKAIINQPVNGDDDINDISTYTKKTPMYESSLENDGGKSASKKYWSQPHEMFARSMEVWVGFELAKKGERNDYLVGSSKLNYGSSLYPDAEHMKRISIFADKWVAALRAELRQVQHPYLGDVQMPIFHSKNRVLQPLNKHTLESFAVKEMDVLFGKVKPELKFNDRPDSASAGMYDFVKNLMILNLSHADKNTFYHEAWHVCHSTMLNDDERYFLSNTFEQDAVKKLISDAMIENGYTDDAVSDAVSNPLELQAYAFELWVAGKVVLSEKRTETVFGDVREVVDGAASISDSFTLKGVESLFERFYGGELALERDLELEASSDTSQYDVDEYFDVGSGSVVYAPSPELKYKGMGM